VTGTINLLDVEGRYTPEVAARAETTLRGPAVAVVALARALADVR
jgi:hypothetical protein